MFIKLHIHSLSLVVRLKIQARVTFFCFEGDIENNLPNKEKMLNDKTVGWLHATLAT